MLQQAGKEKATGARLSPGGFVPNDKLQLSDITIVPPNGEIDKALAEVTALVDDLLDVPPPTVADFQPPPLAYTDADVPGFDGQALPVDVGTLDATQVEQEQDDFELVPVAPTLSPLPWIDDYAALCYELTTAPASFHRLGALVTLATAVGDRARLRMSFGDIRGNIYGAIVADSSAYYKSTALRQVRHMLTRALLRPTLLQAQFTAEGLTRALSEQTTAVIIRDEVATLFASHRIKYLQFLKQDLTALFDGDPYGRLKAGESQNVESPYLSVIGATTPEGFYNAIGPEDWRSGFLARWLFALPDSEPDFESDSRMLMPGDEVALSELATTLIAISNKPKTDFTLESNAHAMWNEWRKESRRVAFEHGGDVVGAITSRYTTYALKIALLLASVTGWGNITAANMTAAIAVADGYKAAALQLFTDRRNHGITGSRLQKVFGLVLQSGGGITTSNLLKQSHLKASELTPVLDTLLDVGAIMAQESGRGSRYTAATDKLPIKSWSR